MSEFEDVMEAALQAVRGGERVALATVVRARGSTPRHSGARMAIWPDGRTVGTIGGATLEQRVIEDARVALAENRSRLANYVFSTHGEEDSVGLCGGSVDVYIESLEPDATLLIVGAGHIAQPLAAMAAALDMRVVVVDDRAEYANRDRFPGAAEVHVVAYDAKTETLAPMPVPITPSTCVVVATWGWDQPALAQILTAQPAYVGLVSSKTKWRVIADRLRQQGVEEQAIARVRAPTGLDLGAETPAEIAVAILAELLAARRGATGRPLTDAKRRQATAGTTGV